MLLYLHVKNLALIKEAEVEFGEGLNILTGETGAGKSILIDSVNIALGGKASRGIIRTGAEFAYVELIFQAGSKKHLEALSALSIYPEEDGQIILTRKISGGKNICKINGESVTVSMLKQAGELLIDIHGQHEHQSLLHKKNHLEILDAYCRDKSKSYLEDIAVQFQEYKNLLAEKASADIDEEERKRKISFIQYEVQEIEEARLKEGEDETLEQQYRRMLNGKKVLEHVSEALQFTKYEQVEENISRALKALGESGDFDEQLNHLRDQLADIESFLQDFNYDLAEYAETLEFDPEQFDVIETRLDQMNHLKSKYGSGINKIIQYKEKQEQELEQLLNYEAYIKKLDKTIVEAETKLAEFCEKLSDIRKKYGASLKKEIVKGLQDLNFLDVTFDISFQQTKEYTANGSDDVEFMISTNPGEPLKPLKEVASGGELSRIMLAIKSVLSDKDAIDTLIFDEIDVGISGRTAQKVSEKMSGIGKNRQVICITHLPQIAAMADCHFLIEKNQKEKGTLTHIKKLNKEESITELARILGGAEITDSILKSAEEMKELAERTK